MPPVTFSLPASCLQAFATGASHVSCHVAFHVRYVALRECHSQAQQAQGTSEATPGVMAENFESANADLEGTLESFLLALPLHLAPSASGAQMLLDEGVADFLPALAKRLLSPDGGDRSFPVCMWRLWVCMLGLMPAISGMPLMCIG